MYRKIVDEDRSLFREITMNEAVMKYITGRRHTVAEADDRLARILTTNRAHEYCGYLWAIRKDEGHPVGYIKMVFIDDRHLEVGYALLPAFWGQKYASEMLRWMVDFNRHVLKASALIGIVDTENKASIRVLARQNFVPGRAEPGAGRQVLHYRRTCTD